MAKSSKSKSLIIVESPAKTKTLSKFLGDDYIIESSVGHIRDLPGKEFGIDVDRDFEPTYVIMPDKDLVIKRLQDAAKKCDTVYLSPDPDREGEAIAWHISQILPANTVLKRVSFNSITKDAVTKALENPGEIDMSLVNAQQARRILDRIVGYKISPLLNRRIQRGKNSFVSAGRVQSVALKLVVDREKEIEAFNPVEYWNISANLKTDKEERNFKANLHSVHGKKIEKEAIEGKDYYIIGDKKAADNVLDLMQNKPYIVGNVDKKEKRRNPVPPFITSTLQQEASRHHGFSSSRTMSIAQGLYEGIDLGKDGTEGLITYMRTDSTRIADEAMSAVRSYILETYGKDYLPEAPKQYSTAKNAQDAHEAIRPTNLDHTPEKVQAYLSVDQFKLYQLIWKRFISSQMTQAVYDTVSADITVGKEIILRATGSVIKFSGFLIMYEEKEDDLDKDSDARQLPSLETGQQLQLLELLSEQAFTRPPPRYTEASLVKELERSRIGRPSTYATIMNKIQSRDYTVKENGRLKPTELGIVIANLLEASFHKIMSIGFTAQMEDNLELVAENKKDWVSLLREFWVDFYPTLETAEKEAFVPKLDTNIDCPKCGSKLQKIWFKSKYFYGCSKYPECDFTAQTEEIHFKKEDYAGDFNWQQPCPKCASEMKVRHGRFGAFLGCINYPECKGIVNIPKKGEVIIDQSNLPSCPAVGCDGHMTARKSRFGKTFYSCSTFPECDVIVNDLSQLDTKYPDHPKTAYIKKPKRGKAAVEKTTEKKSAKKTTKKAVAKKTTAAKKEKKPSNQPPVKLSDALAQITGSNEMPRPEVIKKLWDYIKTNNLQDENNKRLIKPDAALEKVFGSKDSVDMMKLAGLVNKQIIKE